MPRQRPLEVIPQQDAVREPGQRVVQGVVDELRLEPLPVGDVDEETLGHLPATLLVVGHPVGLVADPDLVAVAGEHPVLRAERLAGSPMGLVRGDRGAAILGMNATGPQFRVVDELVRSIPEDARDLRAHVREAAAVGHLGIGQVDVDGGRDVLDEHLQARSGLLDLARAAFEGRGRAPQADEQDDTGTDDRAQRDDLGGRDDGRHQPRRDVGDVHEGERGQHQGAAEQAHGGEAVGRAEPTRHPIHARNVRPRLGLDHHQFGPLAA